MRQKSIRKNGLSLVELMISAAILVAVTLPVFMLFYYYLVAMEISRSTTIAVSDAAFIIESMRGTDPFTINNVVSAYPNGADRAGLIGPQKLKDETVRVFYQNPSADPLVVTVQVDWKDEVRIRNRTLSIDTMMTQR